MARTITPLERMTHLAAYVTTKPEGCTKQDIGADVPGYLGLGEAALEKTLQRDRTTLRETVGIDIEYIEESHRYRIQPPFFTPAERSALITAAALVDVDGVGDDQLPGELGTAVSQDGALVVVRVHALVVAFRDAIAERRTVTLRYNGTERTFDAYVLGMWHHRWYVVGSEHEVGRRVFRLDRIERPDDGDAVTLVGEPDAYVIPADLDPEAELRMDPNVWGDDDPIVAHVRVDRRQAPRFLGEFIATVAHEDRDVVEFAVEVRDYESFVIRVLGFGRAVRLLGPPHLLAMVREWVADQCEVR